MEVNNEPLLKIETENKEIIKISSEFDELSHIKKLEIIFTLKNWVTNELEKIANT